LYFVNFIFFVLHFPACVYVFLTLFYTHQGLCAKLF